MKCSHIYLLFNVIFLKFVVTEYERLIIFRLGRVKDGRAKGPGMFFLLPCVDDSRKVDLRTVSFDVPPQDVLSKDSVTVSVDAVVYYRVEDPLNAVIKVTNYCSSTRLLAMTTLRNMLGTKNLSELLSEREIISSNMKTLLDNATNEWGVKIERVEIKDVCLPARLQRAMATEAEATREAKAKIITAEGELKVSHALKLASETIQDNSTALQLRYLQTLSNISTEKNSTIVFPVPLEFLSGFIGYKSK
ncbi:hypothetical protein RN001_002053 [Aquatica leii]|uniref:Band 7 domain-containing protein n=1 Tax=Aquatica leii TaxID=1421715 RepID=A0AAN7SJX1_9COLE|nr:hypothetical protein RN001_002053 [Aquatica leii]